MSDLLITIVAALFAIGVLVTVHEYGHYLVARLCGIKVLRFSVGFGKPIWRKVAGPDRTEYVLARIPLGGYVKMLDEREGPIEDADRGRAFNHKSVAARSAVLIAGPAANFIFAFIAFIVIFMVGVEDVRPFVAAPPAGSDAERAGIRNGQELVAVNGAPVANWGDASIALLEGVLANPKLELELRDERGLSRRATIAVSGDTYELSKPNALLPGLGIEPWRPERPARIGELTPGGAAEQAGLQPGDLIVGVAGEPVAGFSDLVAAVVPRPNEQVDVTYERDGQRRIVSLLLGNVVRDGREVGLLGVAPAAVDARTLWGDKLVRKRSGLFEAVGEAANETWSKSALIVRLLWKMVTLEVSPKNISGPLNIAEFAGETAKQGPEYYLRLMAMLSLSLGILNLLPIPILDGGQLVFQVAEGIKGSPVSMRTEVIGQQLGVLMLMLLMSVAFYNDIVRLLGA